MFHTNHIVKDKHLSLMARSTLLLLILILPFNIMGIVTADMSYHDSIKAAENTINYTLDSYNSMIDMQISNANYMLYDLAINNVYFKAMGADTDATQYSLHHYQLFLELNRQLPLANAADSIFVYSVNYDSYFQSPAYNADNVGSRTFMQYVDSYDESYSRWFLSENKEQLVRVLYSPHTQLYYGACINLADYLSSYSEAGTYSTLEYSFDTNALEPYRAHHVFSSEIIEGCYLNATISNSDLSSNVTIIQYAIFIFVFVYLALIPVLIFLLRRYIVHPLQGLNDAHSQLKGGNEDYRIMTQSNSVEFNHAYDSFNSMADSIQTLHREVLDQELSKKQLEIDYLQLQIRPHFLLNSFNVLYTVIQQGRKEPAQQMILFLSDYFRYIFRSGHELQLFSKERKLIEDYMEISKIYYPVSFEISYQIDPILDLVRVPPLLLHSFLENIIAHALIPDSIVHIVFSGEYDDRTVSFIISDDGHGMDQSTVDSINAAKEYPIDDGKNIGIKNSVQRLMHYYGEEATFECISELNVGTTFILSFPYDLEEYE